MDAYYRHTPARRRSRSYRFVRAGIPSLTALPERLLLYKKFLRQFFCCKIHFINVFKLNHLFIGNLMKIENWKLNKVFPAVPYARH